MPSAENLERFRTNYGITSDINNADLRDLLLLDDWKG